MAAKPWIAPFGPSGLARCAHAEIEPVGWVMGNVALVPNVVGTRFDSGEVSDASLLLKKGWETALERLRKAAFDIGANGIVSIRLSKRILDEEAKLTEFCMTGTAVRGLPQPLLWTTTLSPGEIAKLVEDGYAPACLAMGFCTWHQSSYNWKPVRKSATQPPSLWPNQEITPATQAAYTARSVAMQRVQDAATAAGARGVVDIDVMITKAASQGPLVGFVVGCEAVGTGVVPHFGGRNLDLTPIVPLQ